jgi:phage regulator Rha-like protein
MGPATDDERKLVMSRSPIGSKYDLNLDKESAFEKLDKRQAEIDRKKAEAEKQLELEKQKISEEKAKNKSSRDGFWESTGKSLSRKVGTKIVNSLWKSLFGGRR